MCRKDSIRHLPKVSAAAAAGRHSAFGCQPACFGSPASASAGRPSRLPCLHLATYLHHLLYAPFPVRNQGEFQATAPAVVRSGGPAYRSARSRLSLSAGPARLRLRRSSRSARDTFFYLLFMDAFWSALVWFRRVIAPFWPISSWTKTISFTLNHPTERAAEWKGDMVAPILRVAA